MATDPRVAIDVHDLGVRYSLRFTRKTTIRESFSKALKRTGGEQSFWALRHLDLRVIKQHPAATVAKDLHVSRGQVYLIKSRLKEMLEQLVRKLKRELDAGPKRRVSK